MEESLVSCVFFFKLQLPELFYVLISLVSKTSLASTPASLLPTPSTPSSSLASNISHSHSHSQSKPPTASSHRRQTYLPRIIQLEPRRRRNLIRLTAQVTCQPPVAVHHACVPVADAVAGLLAAVVVLSDCAEADAGDDEHLVENEC